MPRLRAEREINSIVRDKCDRPASDLIPGCNVELLPDFGTQDASEMRGMFAHQRSGVSGNLVGDPAAACHKSVPSSRFPVLSKSPYEDVMFGYFGQWGARPHLAESDTTRNTRAVSLDQPEARADFDFEYSPRKPSGRPQRNASQASPAEFLPKGRSLLSHETPHHRSRYPPRRT